MSPSAVKSSTTVRLLVLEAELPHPEVHERRGRLVHMFEEIFRKAGDQQKPPINVEVSSRFIVDGEEKLPSMSEMRENYDAVLVTGSEFDAHGDDEWILRLIEWIQGKL